MEGKGVLHNSYIMMKNTHKRILHEVSYIVWFRYGLKVLMSS